MATTTRDSQYQQTPDAAGVRLNIHDLNGAYTMLASDSGKVFTLSATGGTVAITLLPAASLVAGWHCKFLVTVDGSADVSIMANGLPAAGGTTGDAETVIFREFPLADQVGAAPTTSQDGVTVAAASVIGDSLDVITDGSSWFITAMVHEIAHTDDIDS